MKVPVIYSAIERGPNLHRWHFVYVTEAMLDAWEEMSVNTDEEGDWVAPDIMVSDTSIMEVGFGMHDVVDGHTGREAVALIYPHVGVAAFMDPSSFAGRITYADDPALPTLRREMTDHMVRARQDAQRVAGELYSEIRSIERSVERYDGSRRHLSPEEGETHARRYRKELREAEDFLDRLEDASDAVYERLLGQ